jgi:O-antigen/teichoic acid export membrane protein
MAARAMPGRLPIIALALVAGLILFVAIMPEPAMALLTNVGGAWTVVVFLGAVLTLLWFFYWIYLRRIFRARRIASARLKRLIREAAERQ